MDRKIEKKGDKFEVVEIGKATLTLEDLRAFRIKLITQKMSLKARFKELDEEIAGVNKALGLDPGDES